MRLVRTIFAAIIASCIGAACAFSIPAKGQANDGSEKFSGIVDEMGYLKLTSSKGASCKGIVHRFNSVLGEVNLKCDDGRSGRIEFTSRGVDGNGKGELAGAPITVTW